MDRGTKFYEPTGETTEWEDILVKKGIIAPKTKVKEEEEYGDDEEQIDPRHNATLDELDEMDDEYDDDMELMKIREKRIAEMRAQAARNIFGEVQPITKDEWTKEVTEASKFSWVIAYLWDSAVEECKLMDQIIRAIAQAHKDVKFVSIQSLACIENWPQRNVPTLFMYHDGQLKDQLLNIRKLGGLDMKLEDLEEHLASCGVFNPKISNE